MSRNVINESKIKSPFNPEDSQLLTFKIKIGNKAPAQEQPQLKLLSLHQYLEPVK